MKKYPCILIYEDEGTRERELSCEGFWLCAFIKEDMISGVLWLANTNAYQKNVGNIAIVFYSTSFILSF